MVIENFADEADAYFFYTAKEQTDILFRKKEIYDGATPSGNSVMAHNLYNLSILLDNPNGGKKQRDGVDGLDRWLLKYPTSFGVWLGFFIK